MGRVKLKIQRLESLSSRQVTYGKRRAGILKKALEISVLCDIDIILIMFSPTGKPSVFRGQRSNIDEMIAKYAQLTPKERAKRRLESLETLKRNFKKLDQDVDIQEFLDESTPSIEEMHNRVRMLHNQIGEVNKRVDWWINPDKIEDIDHLNQMETSLSETLNRTRMHKDKFLKDSLVSYDCTSQVCGDFGTVYKPVIPDTQFQNGMHFPNEPNFLTSGDVDCSRDAPFSAGTGYFEEVKEHELENTRQMKNERDDVITVDDYACSSQLRVPLGEQYTSHSFGNLNFLDLMESAKEASFQPSIIDYQLNTNFELQRSIYNNFQHNLVPTASSCAISMLNEQSYSYPQVSFSRL
ncbi:mads box protein [Striga asiatica]|uniref:Mads box protein n=1 Tax=Striga asiatica TaxID=4170 RepID=A0A5A7R145_STRAF|nr:mads box protein [Striga asiatica]